MSSTALRLMTPLRGQAALRPRNWSSSHCAVALRLARQSRRLGATPQRTFNLNHRAVSSSTDSTHAPAQASKTFKQPRTASMRHSSTYTTTEPESDPETGQPVCEDPKALILDQPRRVQGPQLSPEQEQVVKLAESGRNVFYTGSAGCGKSTVLRAIVQGLTDKGKRARVIAPTGRAALAVNGTTIWSFAGWTPNSHKLGIEALMKMARSKRKLIRERFRETDVIIIDEISMVENLNLERLNQVMKAARHRLKYPARRYPFGGVQVIITGDFAQLPPAKPFKHCMECGSEMELEEEDDEEEDDTYHCDRCDATCHENEKWAFKSKAWDECKFAYVHLNTIHRQHDADFISLLNKCRRGETFTPGEVDLLMDHETDTAGAVELYPTREEVRVMNEKEFRKLATRPYSFRCRDSFLWNREKHPHLERRGDRHADGSLKSLDEHSMNRLVELKCGMPVVLLVNLDLTRGLCNGSQGVVVGWTPPDTSGHRLFPLSGDHMPREIIEIQAFERSVDEPVWPIVRFNNGVECTIRAECQINELGDDKPYSLLCRTQIPLTPAWAISIHKAQGMTLDKVKVDVSRAFSDGQVYVALSRATSLRGLKIVGDAKGLEVGAGGNKEVRLFYKDKLGL